MIINGKNPLGKCGGKIGHKNATSALFSDGNFEIIPIPDPCLNGTKQGSKYSQSPAFSGMKICELISEDYHDQCAHNDPEFNTYTYGDYPTCNARAANLRGSGKGDYIFFFARLVPRHGGKFGDDARFAIIGYIEVERIFRILHQKTAER